jgi:hypothetical protein
VLAAAAGPQVALRSEICLLLSLKVSFIVHHLVPSRFHYFVVGPPHLPIPPVTVAGCGGIPASHLPPWLAAL